MLNVKALKIQHFSGISYQSDTIATTVLELEAIPSAQACNLKHTFHHTEA